jgi:hypothetical protein
MARGTWTGLYQGYKDVKERQRAEQERQDRLSAATQERQDRLASIKREEDRFNLQRQDKLFEIVSTLAPEYAAKGYLTPSSEGTSGGTTGASSDFYETQLAQYKFSPSQIVSLQEKGPLAMQAAIEVYKAEYDPDSPTPMDEFTTQRIADSILIEDITPNFDPVAFARTMGVDVEAFPESERSMRTAILKGSSKTTPRVASTYVEPAKPIDLEIVGKVQENLASSITQTLQSLKVNSPEDQQGDYEGAIRELKAGDPTKAIELLGSQGLMTPLVESAFSTDYRLRSDRTNLGGFNLARKYAVPQAAIDLLRQNKDDPSVLEQFGQKYNVDPNWYLNG